MPMQLDIGAIKAESRSLLRTGSVNPFRMTLFYLLITLVLDMINSGVSYMIDSAGGFTVLSFSFVSILVGLVALVLNAGYYCYCFGILRREEMPYESLFDAFPETKSQGLFHQIHKEVTFCGLPHEAYA